MTGTTHQTPLQLPQSLHRFGVVAWNLPHVVVLQSQHGFQHETHLRTGEHQLITHLATSISTR